MMPDGAVQAHQTPSSAVQISTRYAGLCCELSQEGWQTHTDVISDLDADL